mgnify:CR=1 FL=1|tara:strand:+ start:43 stop:783 length:741 start_codon:yes stop_codon:yes gene_type:complete
MAISKITSDAIDVTGFNLDGDVGIGTAPSNKLDVLSSGAVAARFKRNNTGGASGGISVGNNDKLFTFYVDNSGGLQFYEDSTERIRFQLGGGISFNGDTAAANALDDYEEGTWTPSFGGTTGNPTIDYNVRAGNYVKIGALVKATFELRTNSISGGSGDTTVYGLPFSPTAVNGTRAGNGYITYTDDFASNQNPHSILITQAETRTFVLVRSSSDSRSTLVSLPLSSLVNATGKNFLIGTLIYTST